MAQATQNVFGTRKSRRRGDAAIAGIEKRWGRAGRYTFAAWRDNQANAKARARAIFAPAGGDAR